MADTLGQAAYEAYSKKTSGRSVVTGDELPGWHVLPAEAKDAWQAAGEGVSGYLSSLQPVDSTIVPVS